MAHASPDILILLEPSTAWSRGILRGINKYARRFGPWQFIADGPQPGGSEIPPGWRGDGAIGKIALREQYARLKRMRVPAVNTLSKPDVAHAMPSVIVNYRRVGEVAAEHLLDLRLEHFAFYGAYSNDPQLAGFADALRRAGRDCAVFRSQAIRAQRPSARHRQVQLQRLLEWVRALPKPVGILAPNDSTARAVIQTCVRNGIAVPEEVAVVGVTNDEVICEMCHPPISSVMLATEQQGYEAADLLNNLMRGRKPPKGPILIDPLSVVARQSTNMLAIDDPDISKAIQFIRAHACEPIQVDDVLAEVPLSRSLLERRFAKLVGRTPADEIRRVRIDKVKYLLARTDWIMTEIARATGFSTAEYMANRFRLVTGTTPSDYRKRMRGE